MDNFLRFCIFLSSMIVNAYVKPIPIVHMQVFNHKQQNNQSLSYSIKPHIIHTNHVNLFTNYTTQQFVHYFQNCQFSQEQILNRLDLYSFNEFIKLIKTYPKYEKKIEELYTEFNNLSSVKKILYRLIGGYSSRLQKRINTLYEEIKKQKQENCTTISPQKNNSTKLSSDRINEYKSLENVYKTYSPLLASAIKKRCKVHSGDELQKVLLTESSDIQYRINALQSHSPLQAHQDALLDCADAIALYSNDGNTEKAMPIADFCWTLLDYSQAIVEGAALGLYNSVHDILTNPIEATVCILAGKQVLTYQLCKVLYNVADIGITALHDYDTAHAKWNDYIEPINTIITAIENKEITLRDTLKTGAALVVGYRAQSKLLTGLGKFFTTVKTKAINFARNNSLTNPQYYLTTPEGMILKASQDAENIGSISKGIVNPSLLLLETTYAKVAVKLKQEIEFLRKKYDYIVNGFAEIGYKKLKIDYEHILGMEISLTKKGKLSIGGFHHDFNNIIEKNNVLEFSNKVIDKHGFYKTRILNKGDFVKNITFFPAHWTREKVVSKIYEAYDNFIKSKKTAHIAPNGKYVITEMIQEGIEIEIWLTQKGCITTAYPLTN